jgi:putative membrane protein
MKNLAFRNMAPRKVRALSVSRPVGGPDGLIWLALGIGLSAVALLFGNFTAVAQDARSGHGAALAASPVSTAEYVHKSAIADQFEMQAGELAAQKSQSPAIREFGRNMVSEHAQFSAKLKTALNTGQVKADVPSALDKTHQDWIQQLKAQSGDQFDQTYLEGQLQGHRDALDLQRAYSQAGDNPALRQLASDATPVVQEHLAKLEVLAQNHFRGPNGPSSNMAGPAGAR